MFHTNCNSKFTLHTLVLAHTRGLITLASLAEKSILYVQSVNFT
jgi:hypothetical protein